MNITHKTFHRSLAIANKLISAFVPQKGCLGTASHAEKQKRKISHNSADKYILTLMTVKPSLVLL